MLILSRLIIKQWFKSLFGAIIVLFLLITTADLINGFLQGKNALRVFLEYSLKMPDLMGKVLPVCCLIASLFSLNKLKAQSELISILASGYSFIKIYVLIGTAALVVVLLQFINLGYIEPLANKVKRQEIQKSKKSEGKYLTRSSLEGGRFWYKTGNYFASFSYFDRKNKTLNDLEVYFFSPDNRGERIIKTNKAIFLQNGQWLLKNAIDYTQLNGSIFPKVSTPSDKIFELEEQLEDFGEFEADLTTLNFIKLYRFISKLSKTGINVGEYEIMILNKLFLSFVCLVFALLPLSSLFNPNRRSSSFGKNVVFTLLITILFWVLYSSSIALGNSGSIPPLIATGLVPFLFFVFVIWTFWTHRKLNS